MCLLFGGSYFPQAVWGAQRDQLKPRKQDVVPEGEPEAFKLHPPPPSLSPAMTRQVLHSSIFLRHQNCPWGSGAVWEGLRGFWAQRAAEMAFGSETSDRIFLPSSKARSFIIFFSELYIISVKWAVSKFLLKSALEFYLIPTFQLIHVFKMKHSIYKNICVLYIKLTDCI